MERSGFFAKLPESCLLGDGSNKCSFDIDVTLINHFGYFQHDYENSVL